MDQGLGPTSFLAKLGCAERIARTVQYGQPGWPRRGSPPQSSRLAPVGAKALRRLGMKRRKRGTGAHDNRDRNLVGDLLPAFPAAKTRKIVGAHEPDETHLRKTALELLQRIDGVAGADFAFDIHYEDPAVVFKHGSGIGQTFRQRR